MHDKNQLLYQYSIWVALMTEIRVIKLACSWGAIQFVLGGILLLTSALAYSGNKSSAVAVKVTVAAAPSCVTNNGDLIIVDFGDDIITKKVDGKNYKLKIPFGLKCTGLDDNALTFQLQGTGAGFGGTNILWTSNPNLGIAIEYYGNPVPINQAVNFNYPNMLELDAVPVKRAGSTLSGGSFAAGLTLTVDYR